TMLIFKYDVGGVSYEASQMGHILRSFVGDAAHVVLKDQHGGCGMPIGRDLLNVNHSSVGDAANLVQPGPSLAFDFGGGFLFPAKHEVRGKRAAGDSDYQGINTKGEHILG